MTNKTLRERFDELWKKVETERFAALSVLDMQTTEFGSVLPTMESAKENLVQTHLQTKETVFSFLESELAQRDREVVELFKWMKNYIEKMEEEIDGEWGACRNFERLHREGLVPKEYDYLLSFLNNRAK